MRWLPCAALLVATPALAQHDHMGHDMPGEAPAAPHDQHSPAGTDQPAGTAAAPAPRRDFLADRLWGAEAMARSRERDLRREHGGMTYHQLLVNIAEFEARGGRDGYRWDGEAWIGGDIDRLTIKSEGDGDRGRSPDRAEVQALYSRALDPYWNLQAGVRYDITPDPSRVYAAVGVEGLAPYWFDVEGTLFVSDKGDVLARGEAWYDQRVTQFVVLQPRVEASVSAQDVPEHRLGSGLTDLELGLRLRWDRSRRFGPYVGVSWERRFGDTARYARDRGGFGVVAGLRAWL